MIKAGIIGGEKRIAGELIRLLVNHPDVDLIWVGSDEYAGIKVANVHGGLIGETDMAFSRETPIADDIDALFLCLSNGESRKLISSQCVSDSVKIIDLSGDFRITDGQHDFVYGLPEINRKYIIRCNHVANPGSIATACLLALLPLAKNLLLNGDIHITAITSRAHSSKAAMTVYKPFVHDDLEEIRQTLQQLQRSFASDLNLIPVCGGHERGTILSAYLDCNVDLQVIRKLYDEHYSDQGFTFISDKMPRLNEVINTNKCLLHLEKVGGKLLAVAVIDDLLKGAAGQAVHNMNLLFGLQERTGLHLKTSAF